MTCESGRVFSKKKMENLFIRYAFMDTVVIGEEDTMVNNMVVVNKIAHLGSQPCHCRGPLYKMAW